MGKDMSELNGYEKIIINSLVKATKENKISWDVVADEHGGGNKIFFAKMPGYSITVKTTHENYTMVVTIFDRLIQSYYMSSGLPPSLYEVIKIEMESWHGDFPCELLGAIFKSFFNEHVISIENGVRHIKHSEKEPFKETLTDVSAFIREIKSIK
jgi:hypothetical protein